MVPSWRQQAEAETASRYTLARTAFESLLPDSAQLAEEKRARNALRDELRRRWNGARSRERGRDGR